MKSTRTWSDESREVSSVQRDVPFHLADGNSTIVHVKDWQMASGLVLPTVSSRFDMSNHSIGRGLVDYMSGNSVSGFETREQLLAVGTPLLAIGIASINYCNFSINS